MHPQGQTGWGNTHKNTKFSSIISYYIYETLIAKRLGGLNRNRNAGLSRYSNRKIQYFLSSVLEPRPRLRRWFGGTLMAPWHLEEWVHFHVRFSNVNFQAIFGFEVVVTPAYSNKTTKKKIERKKKLNKNWEKMIMIMMMVMMMVMMMMTTLLSTTVGKRGGR